MLVATTGLLLPRVDTPVTRSTRRVCWFYPMEIDRAAETSSRRQALQGRKGFRDLSSKGCVLPMRTIIQILTFLGIGSGRMTNSTWASISIPVVSMTAGGIPRQLAGDMSGTTYTSW
jgi:hypothetical protein